MPKPIWKSTFKDLKPICSMYGIFTYIYHRFKPNVGLKKSIHGAFGKSIEQSPRLQRVSKNLQLEAPQLGHFLALDGHNSGAPSGYRCWVGFVWMAVKPRCSMGLEILPTMNGWFLMVNVGKYSSPMEYLRGKTQFIPSFLWDPFISSCFMKSGPWEMSKWFDLSWTELMVLLRNGSAFGCQFGEESQHFSQKICLNPNDPCFDWTSFYLFKGARPKN